jgi:hypothetical protein
MAIQDVKKSIEERSLSLELADKYLRLYIANIDWHPHINSLWSNAVKKSGNETVAKEHVKKAIACATILPLVEKTTIPDPPSNLLFWCTGWKQFNEQEWFDILLDIFKEDVLIAEKRNKIIQIGIIDPIDVSPLTRQAFNWLYEKCLDEEMSEDTRKDVKDKMSNIVRAYGGAVICNIFTKYKKYVEDVMNWRSGYFFEKQIHKVYTVDQIVKIKSAELNKTNNKYIKKVGA